MTGKGVAPGVVPARAGGAKQILSGVPQRPGELGEVGCRLAGNEPGGQRFAGVGSG